MKPVLISICAVAAVLALTPPAAAQQVTLDDGTVDVVCRRNDDILSANAATLAQDEDRLRMELGLLCADLHDDQVEPEEFITRLNALIAEYQNILGRNNTSMNPVTTFSLVPPGKQRYSTLLLPTGFAGKTVNDPPLSTVLAAFKKFASKTTADWPGIVLIKPDNTPDAEMSSRQCALLYRLPNCRGRILVVTTTARPDLWARNGHSPDGVVLDFSTLSDSQVTCFLDYLTNDPDSGLIQPSNIIATMEGLTAKYGGKDLAKKILKPAGWVGKLELFAIDRIVERFPCQGS